MSMPNADKKDAKATAPLWGLVLAGGASRRMGRDKAEVAYHGMPQARWAYALLEQVCERVLVSVASDKPAGRNAFAGLPVVPDRTQGVGPAAGLRAAWDRESAAAWLVLATDLPRVDRSLLDVLIAGRDPSVLATAFRHADGTLEPLCTIWEPMARPLVERAVSLRRVLEEASVRVLPLAAPDRLVGADTPAEAARVRAELEASARPLGASDRPCDDTD
jgi:molybdenum cofactor guanylyltransferase